MLHFNNQQLCIIIYIELDSKNIQKTHTPKTFICKMCEFNGIFECTKYEMDCYCDPRISPFIVWTNEWIIFFKAFECYITVFPFSNTYDNSNFQRSLYLNMKRNFGKCKLEYLTNTFRDFLQLVFILLQFRIQRFSNEAFVIHTSINC